MARPRRDESINQRLARMEKRENELFQAPRSGPAIVPVSVSLKVSRKHKASVTPKGTAETIVRFLQQAGCEGEFQVQSTKRIGGLDVSPRADPGVYALRTSSRSILLSVQPGTKDTRRVYWLIVPKQYGADGLFKRLKEASAQPAVHQTPIVRNGGTPQIVALTVATAPPAETPHAGGETPATPAGTRVVVEIKHNHQPAQNLPPGTEATLISYLLEAGRSGRHIFQLNTQTITTDPPKGQGVWSLQMGLHSILLVVQSAGVDTRGFYWLMTPPGEDTQELYEKLKKISLFRLRFGGQREAAREESGQHVLDSGGVLRVPTRKIRPFADQPRQYFDQEALLDLAGSIEEVGQLEPIKVRMLEGDPDHDYELVDGQRRWHACDMLGIDVRAIVVNVTDVEHQFEVSAVSNFGRVGHTALEIARAIKRIMEKRGRNVAQVAKIFGHTDPWVYQHLSLLKLHPNVQAMMEPTVPEKERLLFSTAIQLAPFPDELQQELAELITQKGLKLNQARRVIRTKARLASLQIGTGRKRGPHDDFRILRALLERMPESLHHFLEMDTEQTRSLFKYRDLSDWERVVLQTEEIIGLMERFLRALRGARPSKSEQ